LTDGILLLTYKNDCCFRESPTTVISHHHGDLDKQDIYMFKTMLTQELHVKASQFFLQVQTLFPTVKN